MTYKEALIDVFRKVPANLLDKQIFAAIGQGVLAVLYYAIRLAVVLTFPISFPILALLFQWDVKKSAKQHEEAMIRLKSRMREMGVRVKVNNGSE